MSTRNVIAALYSVQLLNYALPMVTLPYLSRVLGPAGFGTVGYAQTIAQILLILVDFGFDLTSARKVAIHRHEPELLNEIYWTTTSAKAVLAALSCTVLIALACFTHISPHERAVTLLGALIIWGNVLTPTWFYQGTQRMHVLAASLLLTRVVLLLPLFLWVKTSSDVVTAGALQFSPTLVSGILLTGALFGTRKVSFQFKVSIAGILHEMKQAYHIFLSSALTSVYMYANVVFLRAIAGNAGVGYYVAAEKLTTPLRQLSGPPIQAFFPKMCELYQAGDSRSIDRIIRRFIAGFVGSGVLLFIGFLIFGRWFIAKFLGAEFAGTFHVMQVMIVVPAIIGVAATLVQLCIVASGNQAVLKKIYFFGALFHLCQTPVTIYFWGGVGAACSVAATEVVMTIAICVVSMKVNSNRIVLQQA